MALHDLRAGVKLETGLCGGHLQLDATEGRPDDQRLLLERRWGDRPLGRVVLEDKAVVIAGWFDLSKKISF